MLPNARFSIGAALALAALFPTSRAFAADTLNWATSGYTYNASQAATTTTPATPGTVGTVNGNTLSIAYSTASYFNNGTASSPSPAVGTYGTANAGGATTTYTDGGTGTRALQLFANFDNGANIIAGAGISVTVFFSKPVSNLIFSFYDVDASAAGSTTPFNDYVTNISGRGTGGATVVPTGLTPGVANTASLGSTFGSFTGTGTSNQNVADGNGTVTFGPTPITQFTFTYTDTAANPGGAAHSATQIIALGNLTFTTVPEPSTWACFAMAGGLSVWTLRRRARRQV